MPYQIDNSSNTLARLMEQVQAQTARSQDYLAPTKDLQLLTSTGCKSNVSTIVMESTGGVPTTHLRLNDVAFDQVAARANLPAATARRLRDEYPDVLDHAIRRIWDQEPEVRMVRAYMDDDENSGTARAFVSNKFKTFDNVHLLAAALPQLMDSDAQWKVVTGRVTDKRMYVELKSDVITADALARSANPHPTNNVMSLTDHTREINGINRTVGDPMALGIRLSNSEVGHGSISVTQLIWTLACLNAMQTSNQHRSAHLTSARGSEEFAAILKDDTIEADNVAMKLKLRDLITCYASRDQFESVIEKFGQAHDRLVNVTAAQAVENLGGVLKLTKPETASVLDGLMVTMQQQGYAGRPLSQATLVNAVTAVTHSAAPDNVGDWQRLGLKTLELSDNQWNVVSRRDAA